MTKCLYALVFCSDILGQNAPSIFVKPLRARQNEGDYSVAARGVWVRELCTCVAEGHGIFECRKILKFHNNISRLAVLREFDSFDWTGNGFVVSWLSPVAFDVLSFRRIWHVAHGNLEGRLSGKIESVCGTAHHGFRGWRVASYRREVLED